MPFGSASVSRKPAGFAPLAARSDRLTRSAFCATASGGSSGKEMHAADDGVGREHQLVARRRRQHARRRRSGRARRDAARAA